MVITATRTRKARTSKSIRSPRHVSESAILNDELRHLKDMAKMYLQYYYDTGSKMALDDYKYIMGQIEEKKVEIRRVRTPEHQALLRSMKVTDRKHSAMKRAKY